MTTKLTLTIEDKVISSAKKYAQKKGQSLSHLVENYLKSISANLKENGDEVISPKVLKLMGVIKLPKDFDYKSELSNALTKRYIK
ncbi:MAG: hypothetical protein H7334_13995 [Ferruginibacter sp.]|nr:hypothetical protein [Ferruginibacter sp.]